jgi:hypothetical protein
VTTINVGRVVYVPEGRSPFASASEAVLENFIVRRVGRVWAYCTRPGRELESFRFDVRTMLTDHERNGARKRVWLSREDFKEHHALVLAWAALRAAVDRTHAPPTGVDIDTIREAARALGLPAMRGLAAKGETT